ncbi:MAG: energy-coupling factor transporter transmembrane protein EcfT [Lachnospiraceae bacterium]|nr:energy-coupling factor transporter transmembrane protein EcfT [Lachnospiraceae bacterium]
MNNGFIINLIPGETFLHKLSGTTKVRLFFVLIIYLIMSFDIRLILPVFVAGLLGLFSLKTDVAALRYIIVFVVAMNILNIVLYYLANPHLGELYFGQETLWFQFTDHYIVTYEEVWFLMSRLLKMLATFLVSLVFILSITPSEMAAGLYNCGIPYKICTVVELAFRYIPDIYRDYQNIKVSMQARGVELDSRKAGVIKRLKQTILILIPLIITSFDRVGDISNAMDLRGFGKGRKRSYYSEHEATADDQKVKIVYLLIAVFDVLYIAAKIIYKIPEVWYPW